MTHRTKEYWAEFDMEHMLKNDLWIALKDLAELFARVEALEASLASAVKVAEEERGHTSRVLTRNAELEAENAALKAQVAERDDVIANYLDTFGLPPKVIKIHLEALERVFPCPNLKKEPDNG